MANINKEYVCEKTNSETQPSSSNARALENPPVNEMHVARAEHDNNTSKPELPIEVWEKIFSYLPYADLLQVNAVCENWRECAARHFTSKSKLVISDGNFEEISQLVRQRGAKYKNVKIAFQWNDDLIVAITLRSIFQYIGSGIVYLDVCDLFTLSRLDRLLPKLKEIVLSGTEIPKGMRVDFNQYSKLKSVVVCYPGLCPLPLSSYSNQQLTIRLEKLSINMEKYSNDYVNVLATHAPSLRWLRLIYGKAYFSRTYPQLEDTRLQETFLNFTRLTFLDLRYVYPEQLVRAILKNLSENNQLNTIGVKERPETGLLELIVRKWSNSLQYIDYMCHKDTDIPIIIAQFATDKFRSLMLTGARRGYEWTNQDIQNAIPSANNKITELYMAPCSRGQLFCELVQRLSNLTQLHFPLKSKIGHEEMGYIFRHLVSLQQLSLPVCESKAHWEYLCSESNISNLKSLQILGSCLCPIKVLKILNLNFQFKELRHLHVYACENSENPSALKLVDISQYFPALEMCFTYNLDLGNNNVEKMRSYFPRFRRGELRNILH